VYQGLADRTCPGGLRRRDIKKISKPGVSDRYVSKKKSAKPLNEYMRLKIQADKNKTPEFWYNDNLYRRTRAKNTSMMVYKKVTDN
jgi:hypothetical protein